MAKGALTRAIKLTGTDVAEGKRRILEAGPITAMFAANTELDVRTGLAATLHTDAHQFAHTVTVDGDKRIGWQNALRGISTKETCCVIA